MNCGNELEMKGRFFATNARQRKLVFGDKTYFGPSFGNYFVDWLVVWHGLNASMKGGLQWQYLVKPLFCVCSNYPLLDCNLLSWTDFCIAGCIWDQRRIKWFPSYRLARQGSGPECWEQVIKFISILFTIRTSELRYIFSEHVWHLM